MVRKVSCLWALVLLTCLALPFGAARPARAAAPEALVELGQRWAEQSDFSGSVRLQKNGELLPSINRGTVVGRDTPVDDATVFWIGSVSKQFAAVAILLLAERGELALGDSVAKHLPELRAHVLTKGGVVCSVEHVLSHTCGLPRDIGFDQLHTARHLSQPARAERLFDQVNGAALDFVPGTGYLYSNVGYDLMGLLIQRIAGLPYERFLRDEFWQPLGMTHTGIELRPGIVPMRALIAWGGVLLVGSYWGRWWALPGWKSGAPPRKAYLDLAGQVAALLGLFYFSTTPLRWVFGVVCVIQALAVAGSWLRERSTSSKGQAAVES